MMGWNSAKGKEVLGAGHVRTEAWTAAAKRAVETHRRRVEQVKAARRHEREASEMPLLPDDEATTRHYEKTLRRLASEDRRFEKNWQVYKNWTPSQRLAWIMVVEQQAVDGLDTIGPMVVSAVVADRLGD